MEITDVAFIYWPADIQALFIGAVVIVGGTILGLWLEKRKE